MAHIAGMDAFARGLETAARIMESGALESMVESRYKSWGHGLGASILAGRESFGSLERAMLDAEPVAPDSGKQEYFEALVNEYL